MTKVFKTNQKCSKLLKSDQKLWKGNSNFKKFEKFGQFCWPPAARGQLKITPKVKSEQKLTKVQKVIKNGEQKLDSCKATFIAVVEISERKSSTTHIW